MGASGSAPATPAAPCNKHLAHVSDPRSPTAGILRTPIEVGALPLPLPPVWPRPAAPTAALSAGSPCPPPFLADSVDRLVKQLSEAFGAEAAGPEPEPPGAAGPAEEPARLSSPPAGGEEERPPSPSTARPGRPAGHGFSSGNLVVMPWCVSFCQLVSKPLRHKPNNKFMATSGGTGRSPLSILRDDNSPSAPAPRQGKRHVLGENLGEKEVTVDLSRSLKSGNCAWSDLNKENQQCPFVEN
ncbi:CDCA3 protein, partial [Ifrita kowaldi]|nr:CDCA3 protein [Ifrita kowaldi]